MRPLFESFPELQSVIAHRPLAELPTPVEPLGWTKEGWIKRDDLSHPVYGGNKIRKLEFIIADALARGKKRIVTFGATGTNHGVATALMCREAGLDCTLLLFDQPVTDTVRRNLRLMQALGAELLYCGSLARTVAAFYLHPLRLRGDSYFLFAGGSNVPGTLGFVNAALELRDQVAAGEMPCPDRIICPVGSSATLAGLTLGMALAELPVTVEGVRVAPSHLGPFPACTPGTVKSLLHATARVLDRHLGRALPTLTAPILIEDYFGDGYGVGTDEGEAAIKRFAEAGFTLEPTYTGKAAAAFLDRAETTAGPVLYWHTYNSRDTSALAEEADINQLPRALRELCRHG
jgi:1-aminocyclopropane-1-carboxylate deaminase/D-cysteine desulfhydrase-like pyridoxal-dependent ACC family enzyme